MTTRLAKLLMLIGGVGFVVTTAWWLVFFHDILGDEFQIARECFYWTTSICSLKSTAALFTDIPEYRPEALWASVTVFFVGLFLRLPLR